MVFCFHSRSSKGRSHQSHAVLKGAAGLWAFGATAEDIIYITLPLYHSAASLLGIGGCIELGRARFI